VFKLFYSPVRVLRAIREVTAAYSESCFCLPAQPRSRIARLPLVTLGAAETLRAGAHNFPLLAGYTLNLCFQLITHKRLFAGERSEAEKAPRWSLRNALLVLSGSTALVAWMSEILVGAIEPTTRELGLNSVFVGVFVIAILGNAAEHATAVRAAMNNRMDLSLSIAIGSSVQIALFVAPVLVMLSYFVGPQP
jgi:calcium/proton exchanger cax